MEENLDFEEILNVSKDILDQILISDQSDHSSESDEESEEEDEEDIPEQSVTLAA